MDRKRSERDAVGKKWKLFDRKPLSRRAPGCDVRDAKKGSPSWAERATDQRLCTRLKGFSLDFISHLINQHTWTELYRLRERSKSGEGQLGLDDKNIQNYSIVSFTKRSRQYSKVKSKKNIIIITYIFSVLSKNKTIFISKIVKVCRTTTPIGVKSSQV